MIDAIFIYLGIVFVMSVTSFIAYGLDKRRAVNGSRRVPEQTLHVMAFLGGWPGALLGQRLFRHKTKKTSFLIVFWLVIVLHVVIVGAAAYAFCGPSRRLVSDGSASSPPSWLIAWSLERRWVVDGNFRRHNLVRGTTAAPGHYRQPLLFCGA